VASTHGKRLRTQRPRVGFCDIVRIRSSAVARMAGADVLETALADGATVETPSASSAECRARGTARPPTVRMAVNRVIAGGETALHPDDELALLPPLSGGAGSTSRDRLADRRGRRHDAVRRPGAGAVVTFEARFATSSSSTTRPTARWRRNRSQGSSASDRASRPREAAVEHRVGGSPSRAGVVVAVSAAHRDAAFAGAREVIDQIKSRAPIWKRELDRGEARWWRARE